MTLALGAPAAVAALALLAVALLLIPAAVDAIRGIGEDPR